MASANGYLSLDALRALPRLELDVDLDGVGRMRVQALTQNDLREIAADCRMAGGETDYNLYRQQMIARCLVEPDLRSVWLDDPAQAIAVVAAMHPYITTALDEAINKLTFLEPAEAFRALFGAAASTPDAAATRSTSSNSPAPAASRTRDSSTPS
jgi:hypothetical protein